MTDAPISNLDRSADLIAKSIESAKVRRADFIRAIPSELSKREDKIQALLLKENQVQEFLTQAVLLKKNILEMFP